ncbi:MAG: L-histidine N(alpha)-methyltransferase [Candidatus Pacearchaeota archaeon]
MYSKKEKAREVIMQELIKRGYSLEKGKKVWNVSDSRLWYLTEDQAKEFIKLEKIDEKQRMFVNEEIKLLRKYSKNISNTLAEKNINVVDLGCGDGKKAFSLIKIISKKHKIRYFPIDINAFMLLEAYKSLSKIKGVTVVRDDNNLIDFLDISKIERFIRNKEFRKNLLLLLGGNLENSDIHEILHEIRRGMKDEDVLLIGNKLSHPSRKKMVEYYANNKLIASLLVKPLEILGINKKDTFYFARFKQDRVEMLFEIKKDYEIGKIKFSNGDSVIIAVSYKYTEQKLYEVLTTYFSEVELFVSDKKNFALALCKK